MSVAPSKMSPPLGLALGVLAVSFSAIFIKLCDMPALAIAAWRLLLATALYGTVRLFLRGQSDRLPPEDRPYALLSGLCLGLHFATWISSLSYTSVASSVVLVTINPLFVAIGSVVILREPSTHSLWGGVALSIAGAVTIGLSDTPGGEASNPLLGNTLALLGALFASIYILAGRRIRRQVDLVTYVSIVYGIAAVFLVAAALVMGVSLYRFTAADFGWVVLMALIPQGIGHTMFNWALRHVSAGLVAVATLGEPIGASLLAWWILKQPISAMQAVGAAAILAGVYLASRPAPPAAEP